MQRDEITDLTEPYQPALYRYLCQRLDYVSDVVLLTLSYCENEEERAKIEKDYLNGKAPKEFTAAIIAGAAGGGFKAGLLGAALGAGLAIGEQLLRGNTPEELELYSKKITLARKFAERTNTVVQLKLQILYHNLKADQREKTWAARYASLLVPVELPKLEKSDEKKRGGSSIRFSLSRFTTEKEIDRTIEILSKFAMTF